MRVPPFLIVRCVDVDYPHSMEYGVENPGLLTYPVSHHRGRITFEDDRHRDGSGVGTVFTWHRFRPSHPFFLEKHLDICYAICGNHKD